jgi:hypothetical protein
MIAGNIDYGTNVISQDLTNFTWDNASRVPTGPADPG